MGVAVGVTVGVVVSVGVSVAVGVVVAIAVVIFAMPYLGFLVAGTIFSFVIVLLSRGGWRSALIFSPIATATIYYLFTWAMRVPLPRGLLG